jgi:hypothetical protein
MIKKFTIYLFIISLFSFTVINNLLELVLKKLESYVKDYPEKVYVQTDKPYYVLGETIWYTAYLVNGIDHTRTDKSRVIYVELINEKDSILSKKQLYTNDISAAGDFDIKKDWKSGKYILRAYTNYMRNNDADYFFQKEVSIWDVNKTNSIPNLNKTEELHSEIELTEKPEINFYPEGGYLINDISCKLGIKVNDKNNRNIALEGVIKDSDNNLIADFKTLEFGLGVSSFTPQPNKTYYASLIINNEEVRYPLPKALPQGYQLSIVNNGSQIILKVTTSSDIGLKNSLLVAHQRGNIIFEKLETETKTTYTSKLNANNMQDGIASFTLFDNSGNPVCERLVFIDNPTNKISVHVNQNKGLYHTREKVTLNIHLKDKDSAPAYGNLSMSVTDLHLIGQNSKSENIKSYLLLNSDLRGEIESPGYFFEKENDPRRRYLLDLVMLTHGWRRFTWNSLLYNTAELKNRFKPETGISISGKTTALKDNNKQLTTTSRLTIMGGQPYQEVKQTDANGVFKYGPFVFFDSLPALVEARVKDFNSDDDRNNRNVNIHLDENFNSSPKISRNNILIPVVDDQNKLTNFFKQSQAISKIDAEYLKSATLLDEVVITANRITEQEKRNKLLNEKTNYGSPSRRLDLNDYPNRGSLTISDLLNMLPGFIVFNDSISTRNGGAPGIYFDGIQVQLSDISYLSGNDIEFIDILKGADASFFRESGNGIIAIHSRTGSYAKNINVKRKPGIVDFQSIGFYTAREFYAPDHANEFDEVKTHDLRTTLHWEPKIMLTKEKSKAEISFFTSDSKGRYAIKIEGVSTTGVPIYYLTTLSVD